MVFEKDVNIDRIPADGVYKDRDIYRKDISVRGKYCFRLKYKYTDLFITSDRDISGEIREPVISFYNEIEKVISLDEEFSNSLVPVKEKEYYPPIIVKMCRAAEIFGVGPMASVAGAVCDEIAEKLAGSCRFLMVENGGDVYLKGESQIKAGLLSSSRYFKKNLDIIIDAKNMPCGLCSSSGMMGPSLSMGKSDLVTVMSGTTVLADSAATAIANAVKEKKDVSSVLEHYKDYKEIKGLVIIKDDRLAIWGALQISG